MKYLNIGVDFIYQQQFLTEYENEEAEKRGNNYGEDERNIKWTFLHCYLFQKWDIYIY